MLEREIKYRICSYLNSLPYSWFRVRPPGSPTGEADVYGCLNGHYVAIEVKTPGNKPSKHQAYVMKKIRHAGGLTFTATSIEETKEKLAFLLREWIKQFY
jgi:penicillin-binding protein-related factor A (putative recombinase)